jgi:putative ABC transport system permease protein
VNDIPTDAERQSLTQDTAPTIPMPTLRLARSPRKPSMAARRRASFGASFSSALEALLANSLRSLLTILGVIVGVGAVIVAVSLTQGASSSINARLTGLGTNLLTINSGFTNTGGARGAVGSAQTLTQADADALAGVSHVANVSPLISKSSQVIFGGQNWNTRIQGVYPSFQTIDNWSIDQGAWFSDADESSSTPVAVLGATVADNLFPAGATGAVGQTVLINSQAFRVIGVLQAKGAVGAANQDDVVYVPFSAAQQRLTNSQFVSQIQVQVDSADNVNDTQTAITSLLEQRHNLPAGGPDDFQIRSSNQLVATAQSQEQTLTFLLVGIAAISLLVGGIGIMNIMLVSVTERTREIGIRMAIGARRRDVRDQFLIEALTLSVAGGLIGIAIGLVGGYILTRNYSLPFAVNPLSVLLAAGVSALIGVGFGFYPAVRASRLDPIVALRSE